MPIPAEDGIKANAAGLFSSPHRKEYGKAMTDDTDQPLVLNERPDRE
jgi:hypothetical protein